MKIIRYVKNFIHRIVENYVISRWMEFYSPFRGGSSANA